MIKALTTNHSLARRVSLQAVAMLAVVLVSISAVMAVVAEAGARDRIVQWVGDKAGSVADSIDAFDATTRMMTDRDYKPFRRKFADKFELDAASGMLKSWGMLLNGDFAEVDMFNQLNGGVATIFMRKGDDFERISTSLKKQDGQRAVGTVLDRKHPAYALMLQGNTYTGRAVLFGKPYMTHYEAVKDAGGQVVGILFIGFDVTSFQSSLEKLVGEARFFASGSTVVIDPRSNDADAVFVVHPTAAGQKVLEAYPQAAATLAAMRTSPQAFVDDAAMLLSTEMSHPWVVKRETKSGGLWVVAEVSDDEAMASHWATMYVFWGLLGLGTAVLGLGMYWLVRRNVIQPLAQLTQAVTAVTQGDLSQPFHTERRDEMGTLVREVESMRERFHTMMSELRRTADSIGTASAEIASGNQDLSARTEQTASNLEETAASMEELTATVRNSADAAQQANQLAASASEIAVRGGRVVGQVVTTMEEINHSSKKISDIIGVIDGIAFQTNILALNAAVEAARAGEQGRGFAVVASEVRNLAQRSAEAAKEIKSLIGASVDKVEAGSRLVADAGQTMGEIVSSVQRVSDIIGEITAASGEQSDGIGQVNVAVSQLDQMTQQNAALVEQSAAAAESLKDQAMKLAQVVQVFRLGAGTELSHARQVRPVVISAVAQVPVVHKAAPRLTPPTSTIKPVANRPLSMGLKGPKPTSTQVVATAPIEASAGGDEGDWESF